MGTIKVNKNDLPAALLTTGHGHSGTVAHADETGTPREPQRFQVKAAHQELCGL